MKIVQLFKIYWPDNGGGIATVMESIATAMKSEKQEIVVCQAKRGRKSTVEKYQGVPVYRCSQLFDFASTPFSIRFLQAAHRRTKDSDITIYHFPYPMIDLAVLFGLVKGKLVVWWHCDFDKYKLLMPIYNVFVRHTLKKADRILVSAQGNIDHSNILCDYKEKCTVIPFCVSDGILKRGQKYYNQRKKTPIDNDKPINILFVGRLVWYKGLDLLLKAFAQMKNKNCTLTIVGGGPLEQELHEQAGKLGLNKVCFTGMVSEEEKLQCIENCAFLVLPSTSKAEAFALVQIEAMAFGKPVINTALPSGVPCVSIDGVTGLTVQPGNLSELTQAMDEMTENDPMRETYGRQAYDMVQKEYTPQKLKERHMQVFQELLDEGKAI